MFERITPFFAPQNESSSKSPADKRPSPEEQIQIIEKRIHDIKNDESNGKPLNATERKNLDQLQQVLILLQKRLEDKNKK